MYMLMVIYSIFNMNNVSWGTREVIVFKPQKQNEAKENKELEPRRTKKHKIRSFFRNNKDNSELLQSPCTNSFKLTCCAQYSDSEVNQTMAYMQDSLLQLHEKMVNIERNQFGTNHFDTSRTITGTTTFLEDPETSRVPVENSVSEMKSNVEDVHEEFDNDSILTLSDDIENSWFYHDQLIESKVTYLDHEEENFWKDILDKYLSPVDYTYEKHFIQEDLKDLRDRVVITFVMINSLLILTVFLLTIHNDRLYLNWPINPKINFKYSSHANNIYIDETYLQLEPASFVFLIGFGILMVLQFLAMLYHRFGTYSHIMANTTTDWHLFESDKIENLTEEEMLKIKPIKIFKKLITLEGINDRDSEMEKHVGRRNTVFALALNNKKTVKPAIEDLDEAFETRMKNTKNFNGDKSCPIDKKILEAISKRREEVQRRMSEKPNNHSRRVKFDDI